MDLWSRRASRQSDLVTARQIAGLPDTELAVLATEFALSPRRKRTDAMRFAAPLGVLAFLAGLFGLMLQEESLAAATRGVLSAFEVISLAAMLGGLLAVAAATMKSFSLTSVDLAYGKVGLAVGLLDEQHPWLYKTYLLMRNAAAREYRATILRERGALRGVDCTLMGEIVRADEERVMTLTARFVAEQVQALPSRAAASEGTEPRLVLVEGGISAAA